MDADSPLNCLELLPVCRARCCSLTAGVSAAEAGAGRLAIDVTPAGPVLRQREGRCVHLEHGCRCAVYAHRPQACLSYDCRNDARIWRDFPTRRLAQAWDAD